MSRLFLLLTLFFIGASPRPLTLTVSPRIGTAPQTVTVRLVVAPDARNQGICVGYDGPVSASSCRTINGADAPSRMSFEFQRLQEGHYVAFGVVEQEGGAEMKVAQEFCVLGLTVTSEVCFPS